MTNTTELAPATGDEMTSQGVEQAQADVQHAHDALVIAELEQRLRAAQSEQITDGADPRLERFWERAGRIADHAGFCDEYDRMADELGGPARERDYDVELEVTLTVCVTVGVSARSEEDAFGCARESIDDEQVKDALQTYGGLDDWTVTRDVSAERS